MGKPRKGSGGAKKPQSGPREVTPEVRADKKAANQLSFAKPEYAGVSKNNKQRDRAIARGKVKTAKKPRVYTEKELGIPKLNTALDPVGIKVKGKKGKKFVNDQSMQLILAEVQQNSNEAQASRLEKARQLETIRELRRKEIEEREQKEQDKVARKKKELKKPRKDAQHEPKPAASPAPKTPKKAKKRVSFA